MLFCQSTEAADFLAAVQAAGVLENVTWVGSEAATAAVSTNAHLQPGVMGYLGLRPPIGEGDVYTQFLSRLDAFHAGVVGDWGCSDATDDDGNRLWRQEDADGGDCIWPGAAATSDFYASFSYDAVYTIARAGWPREWHRRPRRRRRAVRGDPRDQLRRHDGRGWL